MTVYRIIQSLVVVEQHGSKRLIMTFETCGHQLSFPIGYFKFKPLLTNRAGKQVYRCQECESQHAAPTGGQPA